MQITRLFRRTQELVRRDVNIAVPMAAGAVMFGAIVLVSWPHVDRPSKAAAVVPAVTSSEVTVIQPPAAAPPAGAQTRLAAVERGAVDSHPAPKPNPQKAKLAAQRPEAARDLAVTYRNCLPACETRDRLTRQAAVVPPPASSSLPEAMPVAAQPAVLGTREGIGDAIIRSGSQAFLGIVSAPATAVDAGRQVADGALRFLR